MSDGYGIQVNMTVNGDLVNVRGDDPEEFLANVKALAEGAGAIHDALTTFKQAGVANGVFTGSVESLPRATPTSSAGNPPPTGGVPNCEGGHGPMKDMGDDANRKLNKKGEKMRNRYYCSQFGSSCKARD